MENCIFCKIINKEIPCHSIYEDEDTLAFLDIQPHAKGHTVVIPKKHTVRIFDLSDEEARKLMTNLIKIMKLVEEKLNPDGFNVGWNHNAVGGQVVPHLHIHILPRYVNDGGGSMHSVVKNAGNMSVEEVAELFR